MSGKAIQFRLAAYTDPAGKWNEDAPKKGNEDDLFVDTDLSNETQGQFIADRVETLTEAGCLMVVADGMGGMNAGEVASAIAIETVREAFSKERLTQAVLASGESRTRYLEKIIVDADAAIKKHARVDKECEGMGSTLIMAWLYDNQVTVSWCGDSRAYLYRESEGIRQISKDHSYVQGLVDDGQITVEEAFDHPYGNIVTRSLGDPSKKAEPESVSVPVCKGDIILVCSDGLSGVLRDRKSYDREGNLLPGLNLEDIIREHHGSMSECRQALWEAAENSEWYDNVTAILCEILSGNDTPAIIDTEEPKPFWNRTVAHVTPKKMILWILIPLALLACAYFAYRYFKPKPEPEDPGTEQIADPAVDTPDMQEAEEAPEVKPEGVADTKTTSGRAKESAGARTPDKPKDLQRVKFVEGAAQGEQEQGGADAVGELTEVETTDNTHTE